MASSVVVLRMEVHCVRCARRIRKAIKSLYGAVVQKVWASPETGHVVVAGEPCLDAPVLRRQLQSMTRQRVDVVNDGGAAEEASPDNGRMVHLGPPQTYGYYYAGGGGWVPAAAPQQYSYGGYGYGARQYVPNEAPVCFNDDNPNGCCVMQ
ncbi:unnamed protein product [Urochloa humidicola]